MLNRINFVKPFSTYKKNENQTKRHNLSNNFRLNEDTISFSGKAKLEGIRELQKILNNPDLIGENYSYLKGVEIDNNIRRKIDDYVQKTIEFSRKVKTMSLYELSNKRYEVYGIGGQLTKLEWKLYLNVEEGLEKSYLEDIKNIIEKKIEEIESYSLNNFSIDVVGGEIPLHGDVSGKNMDIRDAQKLKKQEFENLPYKDKALVTRMDKYIQELNKQIAETPPTDSYITVWRGRAEQPNPKFNTDFELIKKANVGDTIKFDEGYIYTTPKRSFAETWGGEGARSIGKVNNRTGKVMMMKIILPKGIHVSRNNLEVIIPPAEYTVTDKFVYKPYGDMYVTLELKPESLNYLNT